jgi:hypothetical protein
MLGRRSPDPVLWKSPPSATTYSRGKPASDLGAQEDLEGPVLDEPHVQARGFLRERLGNSADRDDRVGHPYGYGLDLCHSTS